MAERKTTLLISHITDDDCGMYRMGEIDTIPDSQVFAYIERYGEYGYQQMLEVAARISRAAIDAIHIERTKNQPEAQAQAGS